MININILNIKVMKKTILTIIAVAALCVVGQAQAPTTFGIGTNNPNGTLHVHSSENLLLPPGPGIEPPIRDEVYGDYLTSVRITNSKTGLSDTDGFYIRQFNRDLTISQLENAPVILQNHLAKIILTPTGRVGIGDTVAGIHKFYVNSPMRVGGSLKVDGGLSVSGVFSVNNNINFNANGGAYFSDFVAIGNGFYCNTNGSLKVKDLRVTLTDWSDFVFDDGYRLMPLGEVERYIDANRHLPDIPSAQEVEENGVDVGEMNKLLLQKVEELTLYIIDLQKQIDELKSNK